MLTRLVKALAHGVAWSLATGASVTLSWWGVHTVMTGTAYDPPRAVPVQDDGELAPGTNPVSSSTHRPKPPTAAPPERPTTPAPPPPARSTPKPKASTSPASSGTSPAQVEDGVVRGYDTKGGRVVLDIGKSSASLVSASPSAGWSMQVWKTSTWIRVEFTTDTEKVSLVCDWYQQQPQVQIGDY